MNSHSDAEHLSVDFFEVAARCGIALTEHVLSVRVHQQAMFHFQVARALRHGLELEYELKRNYLISTSRFGIGQVEGSNQTPLGLHRIAQKIGGKWPAGTVFKGREPIGFTWRGMADAKITTRILWLEGLEAGLNSGGNVDSFRRYIYIHGVGDQLSLGRPTSCGCVHLADKDLVPLFETVPAGTLVWIEA